MEEYGWIQNYHYRNTRGWSTVGGSPAPKAPFQLPIKVVGTRIKGKGKLKGSFRKPIHPWRRQGFSANETRELLKLAHYEF